MGSFLPVFYLEDDHADLHDVREGVPPLPKEFQGQALVYRKEGLSLADCDGKKPVFVTVDFVSGAQDHRRKFGGGRGQAISKAVGLAKGWKPTVLDATAGLGRDAFVLATQGAQVTMLERSSSVFALLEDGLKRGRKSVEQNEDESLLEILASMSAINDDAHSYLSTSSESFDVIYLDPMFPERKKSALVKKDMRMFHELVGADEDADNLLSLALAKAQYRVVVKRPRIAPDLAGREPTYRLEGKSSRFDVYVNKALP